jgi:hypothetical protein
MLTHSLPARQVSEDEFAKMIEAASALPKKFGFDWWQGSPADQFKAIDDNGDGAVSFDEWLVHNIFCSVHRLTVRRAGICLQELPEPDPARRL